MAVSLILAGASLLLLATIARVYRREWCDDLGHLLIVIGSRLVEHARRPETPSGAKLILQVKREWEPQTITLSREGDVVRANFGGKVVRIRA